MYPSNFLRLRTCFHSFSKEHFQSCTLEDVVWVSVVYDSIANMGLLVLFQVFW